MDKLIIRIHQHISLAKRQVELSRFTNNTDQEMFWIGKLHSYSELLQELTNGNKEI